jgi:glycosyltransferase involved in cell wall biosynthesis
MNNERISIILCIYNAGEKLIDTLRYLMKLNTAGIDEVEIIFVDNNSNDNSIEIINNSLKDFTRFSWRIVKESNSGLTYARLKGIQEARFEIMLFCDQDNFLSENYLTIGMNIFKKDTKIAVLGGRGIAKSDIDLPPWFQEDQAYFAVGEQMPSSGIVNGKGNAVYGAGMFVRKSLFLDITNKGFKFFNMSRAGKNLSAGEDTEMCLAFHIAGYKIWYDYNLEFLHFIYAYKLNLEYLDKIKMGIACSRFVTRFYLDYVYGHIPKVGKYFWIKEFLYSLKDLLMSLFIINNKFWIRRNIYFSLYLLQQRSKYNANVKNIISICKSLDKN